MGQGRAAGMFIGMGVVRKNATDALALPATDQTPPLNDWKMNFCMVSP